MKRNCITVTATMVTTPAPHSFMEIICASAPSSACSCVQTHKDLGLGKHREYKE